MPRISGHFLLGVGSLNSSSLVRIIVINAGYLKTMVIFFSDRFKYSDHLVKISGMEFHTKQMYTKHASIFHISSFYDKCHFVVI